MEREPASMNPYEWEADLVGEEGRVITQTDDDGHYVQLIVDDIAEAQRLVEVLNARVRRVVVASRE